MNRKKTQRRSTPKQQSGQLVNQPSATSTRAQDGKAELLVNEVVKNPQVLERLLHRPEVAGFMMQISTTHRSGPLPEAEELARYDKVSPGFAREIMDMAKSAQEFRQNQGKKSLSGAIWKDRIGQIFALLCVLIFSYIALEMINKEAYGYATILLGVELVALAGIFVIGRDNKPPKEEQKKKK
ncbi:DUF2335 domain-containing protein [Pectobacterium brasiliense]|uniref:DUF2335 domain-containing protein n=1 Tax=Pectobacterium brasiliense TaxID=180957 RepID=UPI002A8323C7|nr:DUF2335 domain-containing protein [Pectobacterium brasiliense]MDY4323141.1 DUF2335 domain-containing protein [Pectobacterium brasiliense]